MNARLEVVEFEPIHVTLRDGCSATIRAIQPDDAAALQEAFPASLGPPCGS